MSVEDYFNGKPPTIADAVEFFNRKHCVAHDTGRRSVLRRHFDPVIWRYVTWRFTLCDFRLLWLSMKIRVGTQRNGAPRYRAAADIWLERMSAAAPPEGPVELWARDLPQRVGNLRIR